jgi:hypothetical protein
MSAGKGGSRPREFRRAKTRDRSPSSLAVALTDAGKISETQRQLRRDDALYLATCSKTWGEDVWYGGAEYPPGLVDETEMVWCVGCNRHVPPQAVRGTLRRFIVLAPDGDVLAGVYGSCYADAKAEAIVQFRRPDVDVAHVRSDGVCDTCAVNRMPFAFDAVTGEAIADPVAAVAEGRSIEPGPALMLPSSASVVSIHELPKSERKRYHEAERIDQERRERKAERRRFKAEKGGGPSPMKLAYEEYKRQAAG